MVEEHGRDDGGSSSQPSKRLRRNHNPKSLRRKNPSASPTLADPTPAASPTRSGSESTQSEEAAGSQNLPVTPLSRSSTRRGTPSSE